jgi:hypothetical protein
MQHFWQHVEHETLSLIEPWQRAHVPAALAGNTALYPLSGADFINLYAMFPLAPEYVMFALNEPGPLPDPLKLDEQRLSSGLEALRRVIRTVEDYNYMFSSRLRKGLANTSLTGITPVLLTFVAGLELEVVGAQEVGVDAAGMLRTLDASGLVAGRRPLIPGVRVRFRSPGRELRALTYLQITVDRDTARPGTATGEYLRRLGPCNTMLKSAGYLFHGSRCASTRDVILDRSVLVIQDDSGIPYGSFVRERRWTISLYGRYLTHRMSITGIGKVPLQEDLLAAYHRGAEPIAFKFGYGALREGRNTSTLMLMIRKPRWPAG